MSLMVKRMAGLLLLPLAIGWGGCAVGLAQEGAPASPVQTQVPSACGIVAAPTTSASPSERPPLSLCLTDPEDESVSEAKEIEVKGTASPSAVVSVNGRIVATDAAGGFSTKVVLAEGANPIEVIASDAEGNEVRQILVVFYLP